MGHAMSTPIFPHIDRALGGRLVAILRRYRGDGLTYQQIALQLHIDHDVNVTAETVRKWCRENDLVVARKATA